LLKTETQSIRAVSPAEIDLVSVIEQASFKDPYPAYFLNELARDNPDTFLVVTVNERIVGYGVVDRWEDHDHLISLAVHPENRRRGIAKALLRELETRLSSQRPLRLEVRSSNHAAIQLYSQFGFRQTGLEYGYYTDGEDAITMEKPIVRNLVGGEKP